MFFPASYQYVGNTTAVRQANIPVDDVLIVLDPGCSHCQHLYEKMATQGTTTNKIALLCRWKDEDDLLSRLTPYARPVAFPHAIDLQSGDTLSVPELEARLGLQ
jgi:hypothetical protein